ncbi:type 1 glutamine amidotransferase [Paracoccaceae bacterium]
MHIAVLMANTDESAFAQAHPGDGERFRALLQGCRPDWEVTVFSVKNGVFPPEEARFDGWLITGSPASVNDDAAWIGRLLALIRRLVSDGKPLFGACFGHQAIAKALGGTVGANPGGWVMGLVLTAMEGHGISLYAAHREQILALPPGAVVLGGNAECPVGSMAIGPRVLTTQYHPEMSAEFVAALVEAFAAKLPEEVIARARASLRGDKADTGWIAERIAKFYEAAVR